MSPRAEIESAAYSIATDSEIVGRNKVYRAVCLGLRIAIIPLGLLHLSNAVIELMQSKPGLSSLVVTASVIVFIAVNVLLSHINNIIKIRKSSIINASIVASDNAGLDTDPPATVGTVEKGLKPGN